MTYLTSYVDGLNNVETLNGFTDEASDFIVDIYNEYSLLTGFTGYVIRNLRVHFGEK